MQRLLVYTSPFLTTFGTVSDITRGAPGRGYSDIAFLPNSPDIQVDGTSADGCAASLEDFIKGNRFILGSEECKALGF